MSRNIIFNTTNQEQDIDISEEKNLKLPEYMQEKSQYRYPSGLFPVDPISFAIGGAIAAVGFAIALKIDPQYRKQIEEEIDKAEEDFVKSKTGQMLYNTFINKPMMDKEKAEKWIEILNEDIEQAKETVGGWKNYLEQDNQTSEQDKEELKKKLEQYQEKTTKSTKNLQRKIKKHLDPKDRKMTSSKLIEERKKYENKKEKRDKKLSGALEEYKENLLFQDALTGEENKGKIPENSPKEPEGFILKPERQKDNINLA